MNELKIPEFITRDGVNKAKQEKLDRLKVEEVEEKELKIPAFMLATGTYKEDKPKYEKPVIIVNEEHLKKVLEARKKYMEAKKNETV